MRVIEFSQDQAEPIRLFNSVAASSLHLGDGQGEIHLYCVFLDPGGEIGPHTAGFDQLFLVVQGAAWAAGEDGTRVAISAGKGAHFARGEVHSKGSELGATVIMIQASDLSLKSVKVG